MDALSKFILGFACLVTIAFAFVIGSIVEGRTGWIPYGAGISYDATARERIGNVSNRVETLEGRERDDRENIRSLYEEINRNRDRGGRGIGFPQGAPVGSPAK